MADTVAVEKNGSVVRIDTSGVYYRQLNARLRELVADGVSRIELSNVCGQRYIGTDLSKPVDINITGTPGNDLGAFMLGPRITVHGNAQDGCGNTMDDGLIVVHGHAGDIIGLSARGGKIFIRDDVGYRAGIHMKEYGDKKPALVIGGTAQDFLGEYMAGGTLVLLGLNLEEGQHREVGVAALKTEDKKLLGGLVGEYAGYFGADDARILDSDFIKIYPRFLRPYGRLYAY